MNYCDFLFNSVDKYSDHQVLIDLESGCRFSYRQLQEKVIAVAGYFKDIGAQPGQVIATHLYNGAAAVVAHLAIQYCGAITCLLDPLTTATGLIYYLQDSGATFLCTHLPENSLTAETEEEINIITDEKILALIIGESGHINIREPHSFSEDDVATIFYTSGTTSQPKGVMLPTRSFFSHVRIFERACYQYEPQDNLLCFVPFSHGYGSKSIFLPCLQSGATMVLLRSFHPLKVVQAITDEKISYIFGVPSHYQQLLRREEFIEPLRKLKAAFSAAALLKLETARNWKAKIRFYLDEGYGLIETCTGVAFRRGRLPDCLGHLGDYPKDLVDIEIVDEEFQFLPSNDRGEIVVRGPSVMLGYLNKTEETQKSLHNGWFRTGDMGYKTNENELIMTGRIKDVINIAGIKVAPFEIEAILNEHPSVNESAVIGIDDEIYGEVVKAFVKRAKNYSVDERSLIKYLQNRMINFQVPKQIVFIDKFPRNNMGKIDKRVLRKISVNKI